MVPSTRQAKSTPVKHTSLTCPWNQSLAANAAAAAAAEAADSGSGSAPGADLLGVDPQLRSTLAGCVDSLAACSVATGEDVTKATLTELTEMLGGGNLSFTAFKTVLMGRMAADGCKADDVARYASLIAAGAAGAPSARSEIAPVANGMPKVGVREKIFNALIRKAKADHKHLGAPAAEPARVLKVGLDGAPYYEHAEEAEAISTYPLFMLVVEWMRHAYLGLGLATEHSIHFFVSWHMQRLMVGDAMSVVQRTLRLLVRVVDTGTRDWVSVVEQDGAMTLDLVRAATRASFSSFPNPAPHAKTAPSGAKEEAPEETKTKAKPCPRFNTVDPEKPDQSLPCLFRGKDGRCKNSHTCRKQVGGGRLCGGSHPEWQHKD